MAYNFLGLVNNVNRRLNEVELKSGDFASATGFYSQAKDAINSSIRYVNQSQYNWPFNHVTQEDTMTAGEVRYGLPHDNKIVNMNTFRIKKDSTLGVDTRKLKVISYEEYLEKHVHHEYSDNDANRGVPTCVFQTPSLEYGLVPAPDKAYEVVYEYYRIPVDLEKYDDVPGIPERFAHVIVDGAMHYAYLFRGNTQDALVAKEKFEEGIKNMRSMLVNRYDYVRSGYIIRSTQGTIGSSF